jgi:hypothetical protein
MSEEFQDGGGFEGGDAGGSATSHVETHTGSPGAAAPSRSEAAPRSPSPDTVATPDWRTSYLDGLDDGLKDRASKYLERRKGHNDVLKSALEGESKISELSNEIKSRIKIPTGKDDKPEDIEAFRKAIGVPEAADAYQVWAPEGSQWDDQRAGIKEFLADAHGVHLSQKQVDVCLQALARTNAQTMQQWERSAKETVARTQAALKKEHGREFQANRTLAFREMENLFGTQAQTVADIRLADGSFLGDNVDFARGMIALVDRI